MHHHKSLFTIWISTWASKLNYNFDHGSKMYPNLFSYILQKLWTRQNFDFQSHFSLLEICPIFQKMGFFSKYPENMKVRELSILIFLIRLLVANFVALIFVIYIKKIRSIFDQWYMVKFVIKFKKQTSILVKFIDSSPTL